MTTLTTSRIEELETYEELIGLVPADELPADPRISRCFVWRDEQGQIGGYCFIQTVVVIEPLWVKPDLRRKGVAPKLYDQAIRALGEGTVGAWISHATSPEVEGYLRRLGMKEIGRTFQGEVGGQNGQHS